MGRSSTMKTQAKERFHDLENFMTEYEKLSRAEKREFVKWAAREMGVLKEREDEPA
jgi:uridine kinase